MPPKEFTPSYRSVASSITCSSAFSEQDIDGNSDSDSDTGMPLMNPLDPDSFHMKDKAPSRPARQMSVASSSVHGGGEEEEGEGPTNNRDAAAAPMLPVRRPSAATMESQLLPDAAVSATADAVSTQMMIDSFQKELEEKRRVFQTAVKLRDRKYHFRTFKRCFVGSEAIDTMLSRGLASTREEAQTLGNHFLLNGWFRHVCGEHQFEDGYLFYRFLEDEDVSFRFSYNHGKRNSGNSSIFSSNNSSSNSNSSNNENKLRASFRPHTIPEEGSQADASGSS